MIQSLWYLRPDQSWCAAPFLRACPIARSGPSHSAHRLRYFFGVSTRRFTTLFVGANVLGMGTSLVDCARPDIIYVVTAYSRTRPPPSGHTSQAVAAARFLQKQCRRSAFLQKYPRLSAKPSTFCKTLDFPTKGLWEATSATPPLPPPLRTSDQHPTRQNAAHVGRLRISDQHPTRQDAARVGRLRISDQHRRAKTPFVSCRAGAANTKNHGEMRSRPTYNKRPVKKAGTLGDAWDEIVGGDLCNPPLPLCEQVTSLSCGSSQHKKPRRDEVSTYLQQAASGRSWNTRRRMGRDAYAYLSGANQDTIGTEQVLVGRWRGPTKIL